MDSSGSDSEAEAQKMAAAAAAAAASYAAPPNMMQTQINPYQTMGPPTTYPCHQAMYQTPPEMLHDYQTL